MSRPLVSGFVLRCIEGHYKGHYVATGCGVSYTKKLERARVFASYASAEADCCGNERIIPLAEVLA